MSTIKERLEVIQSYEKEIMGNLKQLDEFKQKLTTDIQTMYPSLFVIELYAIPKDLVYFEYTEIDSVYTTKEDAENVLETKRTYDACTHTATFRMMEVNSKNLSYDILNKITI